MQKSSSHQESHFASDNKKQHLVSWSRASMLISKVRQDSLKKVSISVHPIIVQSRDSPYAVYYMRFYSEYYEQEWIINKRFSEFYNLRQVLLKRLKIHKQEQQCAECEVLYDTLKKCRFPNRVVLFTGQIELINKRTEILSQFINEVCDIMGSSYITTIRLCEVIIQLQSTIKGFFAFPLEKEHRHVLAIRSLEFQLPRQATEDSHCSICLTEWDDKLNGSRVQSCCGHFFHESCINEWFKKSFYCPLCRAVAGEAKQ